MPQYDKLIAYHNGAMVPLSDLRVSIFDSVVMMGDMVYEMTRTFAHKPFLLDRHLDRLQTSMAMAEIDCGLSRQELETLSLNVLEANLPFLESELDFVIRHDISRGPVSYYHRYLPGQVCPTVIISCYPLVELIARVAQAFDTGVHAVVPVQQAIPSRYLDPKAKTRSRLHYQMANLQASRVDPNAWAVMVDERGCLAEGTSSNFFLVRDGVIYSPESHNILRGVSRSYVAELAADLGYGFEERSFEPYDVLTADEAFFTASTFCLVPATRFNCRPIGDGVVGPVVKALLAGWGRRVGVDIVAQAKLAAEEHV